MKRLRFSLCGPVFLIFLLSVALAQSPSYKVQPGDTLYSIARHYGTTVEVLAQLNGLTDPNALAVGQVLLLPGGQKVALPTTLPAPLSGLSLTPQTAEQGRVVALSVKFDSPLALKVHFLGLGYTMAPTPGGAEVILAVPPLQAPGVYPLDVTSPDAGAFRLSFLVRVAAGNYPRSEVDLPPASTSLLADRQTTANELAFVRAKCRAPAPTRLWTGEFRIPIARVRVTFGFGTRVSYNHGPYSSYHEGIDFHAPIGTPVHAAADGKVIIAKKLTNRGNAVYLQHGWDVCSGYLHLSKIAVKVGEEVGKGDLLGYSGDTGFVTGPHLHWEVRVNGIPVDPMQWVKPGVGLR